MSDKITLELDKKEAILIESLLHGFTQSMMSSTAKYDRQFFASIYFQPRIRITGHNTEHGVETYFYDTGFIKINVMDSIKLDDKVRDAMDKNDDWWELKDDLCC